ncbi:MAG: hypothetical protein A2271_02590 [Candidatus Moranbacteria bacterium RIFOXYA12_FULL_35_19]|nr:MAG: hypothetical protein UR78_C0014G0003 [Candidatus Moranbacteria bacterium GW2011_GWF2_35_39]OGI32711.1 MAG: hypothetical protein A2489_00175 [Candidatus Moranbacteria bacterium RIFOXYC12_FULL_36_13]OGI36687.1 MAG: hypothetical protein A2271_02590 [Candidatus Moranbacteria bacterium RIFOXYA12_FULL_35_19]
MKKFLLDNILSILVIVLLFFLFILESFDVHVIVFTWLLLVLSILLFIFGIIFVFYNKFIGLKIILTSGILILMFVILNIASKGVMNLKKNFIIKQGYGKQFSDIISDIERYKYDTGKYPKKLEEIKERYNTNLSKKCFWGMCTDIYYYRESDNENIYNLKICNEHDTGTFVFTGCGTDYCVVMNNKHYNNNLTDIIKFNESLSCI